MKRIAKPLLFLSLAVSLTALSGTASAHERGHDNGRGWGQPRHDHFRGHHDDRRYDRDDRHPEHRKRRHSWLSELFD